MDILDTLNDLVALVSSPLQEETPVTPTIASESIPHQSTHISRSSHSSSSTQRSPSHSDESFVDGVAPKKRRIGAHSEVSSKGTDIVDNSSPRNRNLRLRNIELVKTVNTLTSELARITAEKSKYEKMMKLDSTLRPHHPGTNSNENMTKKADLFAKLPNSYPTKSAAAFQGGEEEPQGSRNIDVAVVGDQDNEENCEEPREIIQMKMDDIKGLQEENDKMKEYIILLEATEPSQDIDLKKKIVDLQKKNGELHSQLFEEQKESSKLREENKILRKQHDEMTSFAKHTGDENDEVWSERVKKMEESVADKSRLLNELQAEKDLLANRLRNAEQSGVKNPNSEELQIRLDQSIQANNKMQQKMDILGKTLKVYLEEIEQLKGGMKSEDGNQEEISNFRLELGRHNRETERILGELKTLREQNKSLTEELEKLKLTKESLEKQNDDMKKELIQVDKFINDLNAEIDAVETQQEVLKKQTEEIEELRNKLEKAERKRAEGCKNYRLVWKTLLEERNTHDRLVKEDREKLTKLAEFSSKYVDLKRQLGDLKKDYAYLLQHKKKETTEDQPIQKKLNPNPAAPSSSTPEGVEKPKDTEEHSKESRWTYKGQEPRTFTRNMQF